MNMRHNRSEWVQAEDNDGRPGVEDQTLVAYTTDCGAEPYLVIETERWAIEDVDVFCKELKALLATSHTAT